MFFINFPQLILKFKQVDSPNETGLKTDRMLGDFGEHSLSLHPQTQVMPWTNSIRNLPTQTCPLVWQVHILNSFWNFWRIAQEPTWTVPQLRQGKRVGLSQKSKNTFRILQFSNTLNLWLSSPQVCIYYGSLTSGSREKYDTSIGFKKNKTKNSIVVQAEWNRAKPK